MNLVAIICEYNPLHNGHLHQIEEAKRATGADAVMCIISGNFTQRAETAIMDKYERAKAAVLSGADVVINIPTIYSSNNAEVFSLAAVKMANSFKQVKWLSFGMEQPNIEVVKEVVDFLNHETPEFKTLLKNNLDKGISFSNARINAVKTLIEEKKLTPKHSQEFLKLLTMPNNILAVEYVKALKNINSHIQPVPIKRVGSDYNDTKLKGKLSSATAIRNSIYSGNTNLVKDNMPTASFELLDQYINKNGLVNKNKLMELALFKFKTATHTELKQIYNISEGLENRLINLANKCSTAKEFEKEVYTKRYKNSRMNQVILNAVLGIYANTVKHLYSLEKLPYIKVLAINKNNKELMRHLKCTSKLIIRRQNTEKLRLTKYVKELIAHEDRANSLYNLMLGKNVLSTKDLFTVVKKV